jgi:hypothetical protein
MKTLLAAVLLTAAGLAGAGLQISSIPCPTEDSTGCYWDADTRGNRAGQSYLSLTESLQIQTGQQP